MLRTELPDVLHALEEWVLDERPETGWQQLLRTEDGIGERRCR